MMRIYRDEDGDLGVLSGVPVGVIGYGSMGRSVALNLRDSGLDVRVGVRNLDESSDLAALERFSVAKIEDVVQACPLLFLLIADDIMPEVYLTRISPHLRRGQTLIFASGFNLTFRYIEPPSFVDVGLIAPRTLAAQLRNRYVQKQGFLTFVAANQDASGRVWRTILALAKACGALRGGALELSVEQETELDLFMQQAILPAFHHIMVTAAQFLIDEGYPPEAAMLDLYVSGELNEYIERASDNGLLHALRQGPAIAQFGAFTRLERFKELKMERLMAVTLEEIRRGRFAQEWSREYADGYPRLKRLLHEQEQLDLWEIEQQTIELFRAY
ncbi:MAG: NAD(P)-binding domain-containing protein [Anaerolineae bacterium]|nr:NAD(P)-binding domain-containing protein [Anaerolineae bacterium]MDW8171251.1 NAD(P)-binding domain-containing protein [Anaerolineae bacterium]